jgi:aminoglycoside phosphotransferase (APT) family kinase protein
MSEDRRSSMCVTEIANKNNNMERPFLGKLYFALFLWKTGLGDLEAARRYLAEAMKPLPSLVERQEELLQVIADWAVKQPYGPPSALAQRALDNLPGASTGSGRLRRRALGKIHVAQAFAEYAMGHGAQTRRHVLNGLRYDPSFLKNRGVVAILARSFLNKRISDLNSMCDRCQPDERVPQSVISGIEAALDCAVDSAKPITSEEPGKKNYLVQAGGRLYILRLIGKDVLEQRIAAIERVRAVGVPAPAILASASLSATDNERAWLLEEWMPGSWFDPPEMSCADELATAADLGRHLRRLHTINTKGFGWISSAQLDAPYSTFAAWLDSRQQLIAEGCMIGAIPEATLPALDVAARFLRESYAGPPVLCHLDLAIGNILLDEGRVTAIIDWESQGGGDPAYDIAVFLTRMSPFWYPAKDSVILTAVLQAYGADEPDNFYRRVVAQRLLFAATEVARLMNGSDDGYLNACQSILAHANLVH